jgi:hypothetical protein
MNLVANIADFNATSISFLDLKKNNVIDGNFSKIIYDDSNVTFNGIYLSFHIIPHHITNYKNCNYSIYYLDSNAYNAKLINELVAIEASIIDYYREMYKINKTGLYQLKHQLQMGNIKIYKKEQYSMASCPPTPPLPPPIAAGAAKPDTTHHYYTNTYILSKENNHTINSKKYLLKIAGIWENKINVGITYKFTELQSL